MNKTRARSRSLLSASYLLLATLLVGISILIGAWKMMALGADFTESVRAGPVDISYVYDDTLDEVTVSAAISSSRDNPTGHALVARQKNVSGSLVHYWNYVLTSTSTTCNASAFSGGQHELTWTNYQTSQRNTSLSANVIALSTVTSTSRLCLQVQYSAPGSSTWISKYVFLLIDRTIPVVGISQNGLKLNATVSDDSDILATSWAIVEQSAIATTDTCSSIVTGGTTGTTPTTTSTTVASQTISTGNHDSYYCFYVSDKWGNTGYSSLGTSRS